MVYNVYNVLVLNWICDSSSDHTRSFNVGLISRMSYIWHGLQYVGIGFGVGLIIGIFGLQ